MQGSLLCFVGATVWMAHAPIILYSPRWVAAVPLALFGLTRPGARLVSATFLGILLAGAWATSIDRARLPARLEGRDLVVTGVVSSLPAHRQGLVRFQFDLSRCPGCSAVKRVALSWYKDVEVSPGEVWRLTVRLNRPRGSVNPGLFDYEGWLFSRAIGARGYVREQGDNVLLARPVWRVPHHRLRDGLRKVIRRTVDDPAMAGLLIALTIGDSSHISPADWKILSNTGTNHLFIISGLHVGLVAGLFYRLFLFVTSNRRRAGLGSLVLVFGYAWIAGMGLPVQRALIMTMVAMGGLMLNRKISASALFCIALAGVTITNPLAALSTGFWLSFGAVFSLLFAFAGLRSARPGGWRDWLSMAVHTQWVVYLGMLPLLLYLVFQVSLVSFLVNLVAIPWIGIVVVPALLAASVMSLVSDWLAGPIFLFAEQALSIAWQSLAWVAARRWVYFAAEAGLLELLIAVVGAVILLLPRGFVPRWPGVLMLVPLVVSRPGAPAQGELHVTVFDVGQGLSVLLRTHDGAVLYDAGPRYSDRFDAGEQIVTPSLRRAGIDRLDALIVSHPDNDHAGGAAAVLANFPVARIWASDRRHMPAARSCQRGGSWHLGGVDFRLIGMHAVGRNDRSCVLLAKGTGYAVLLPGDVEARGEDALLEFPLPDIDLMLAPHHGSQSSSTPAFLNHVMADTIIVSAGYRNRFGHPDTAVVRRYLARHARVLVTAQEGALSIRLGADGEFALQSARRTRPRLWHDPSDRLLDP